MIGALRPAGVVGLVLLLFSWAGVAALAEPPSRLAEQVTDSAGALTGDETEVRAALDELRAETGVQLFVVFVDTFDGTPAQQWADETARLSDLGTEDYLMAVAVEDRAWAYSVAQDAEISDDELRDVAGDIEARLAADDWSGAVVAAADGYREALTGGGAAGVASALPWVLGAAGVAGLSVVLLTRRRSAKAGRAAQASLEDLEKQANRLLVETDDAVRSSETELGFAVAEFGAARTEAFEEALRQARAALARGFAVRQQLDDDVPETPEERRRLLTAVIEECTRANEALDAEADRFDELRDLLTTAPQRLDAVLAEADQVSARVPTAEAELAALRERYAATALASVEHNVAEAQARLDFARRTAAEGQAALASTETRAQAGTAVQAAEQALAQARQLLDAVARAGTDLADAVTRLPDALAELRADLAAARTEGVPAPALAAAEEAVAFAESARASDPLGALHRVVDADRALEQARTTSREDAEQRRRAEAHLQQALLAARAEVAAVEDYVATRRGAVGSQARTRLAEARRHLETAERLAPTDPAAALVEAQQADRLAEDAGRLARGDVDGWYSQQQYAGYGGGIAGGRSDNSGLLAGIILGQILGGGGGGGFGGGFGGAGRRGGGGGFGG
ncbi:MAG: TPM domain-containing protein, partial [Actinomycetota bacterium]